MLENFCHHKKTNFKAKLGSASGYHDDDLGVYGLGEHVSVGGYVVDHLVKRCPLDLLPLEVGEWVLHKVEQYAALLYLLHEQVVSLARSSV